MRWNFISPHRPRLQMAKHGMAASHLPSSKEVHSTQKAEKGMFSFFFDDKGPLFIEWLQTDAKVKAEVHFDEAQRCHEGKA